MATGYSKVSRKAIIRRLQEVYSPGEDKKEVRWRILPIHSAIILHTSVEVIEALVEAYPGGLMKGDYRKMLPLQLSFRLGSSLETAAVRIPRCAEKKRCQRTYTSTHTQSLSQKVRERP